MTSKKEVIEDMETLSFDSSALKKFVHPNELGEMQAMVTAADSE